MNEPDFEVPAEFPQRSIGSGLAGLQPKVSVTEFEGRYYTLGNTPAERHARYVWCLDLAEQFVEALRAMKAGKRKDMPEADILQQYHDRTLKAGWGVEPAEADWIFRHVAANLGWPIPESLVPKVQDLHALAEHILSAKQESWWNEPSVWLNHQTPSELAQTCPGRQLIWEYLKRVESGIYT